MSFSSDVVGASKDAVGTKRLLIIEIWVFILGNLIAGLSKGLTQLVAGRLISGVGGAGLLSLSSILVSQLTNERQRGAYLNLINLVFTVADAIGPLVGGGFSKSGNWRWIFLFNAPFGPVSS
ncbi:major facilitator superfamily domain-containing protein [Collybia nuda]|nr:major facilitator superfamily domain-containing protein [Collybia nuda]